MRKKIWIIVPIGLAAIALFGSIVMSLWNWLGPAVFGGHTITYWQALGILLLSKILFGGFHRPGFRDHWKRRLRGRWAAMTPAEREKFLQGMESRCGHRGAFPPPQSSESGPA